MYFPPMFHHLFNFGYQRRGLEVFGFFIAYLLGMIMLGAVVGSTVASIFGTDAARTNWRVDSVTASIVLLVLSHLIIRQKHLHMISPLFMILPLGAAALTLFLSSGIALLIPTVLSSLPPKLPYTPPPTSSNDGANEQTVTSSSSSSK